MTTADIGPTVDPRMAILTNRLPFMDLEKLCEEHNYTFAAVWRPMRSKTPGVGEVLTVDEHSSHGAFALRSLDFEFKEGDGLPGRCYQKKDVEHVTNLQKANANDARSELAQELKVNGAVRAKQPTPACMREVERMRAADMPRSLFVHHAAQFAIWRDGAVWEFGGSVPMQEKPDELINSIGGSTGVKAAAKAVQAVVRLGAMAKKSKLSETEAEQPDP